MMSSWQESLRIGIPLIDFQHKQLLDQLDQLSEALQTKQDLKEIKLLLSFLDMYVNNHFGYEESCMELHKCPVACNNKTAHMQFVRVLNEIRGEIEQNRSFPLIANRINLDLINWFVNHIRGIDSKLAGSVKKA